MEHYTDWPSYNRSFIWMTSTNLSRTRNMKKHMLCNSFYIKFKNRQHCSGPSEARSHCPADRRTQGMWNLLSWSGDLCTEMYQFVMCDGAVHLVVLFCVYIIHYWTILKLRRGNQSVHCQFSTQPVVWLTALSFILSPGCPGVCLFVLFECICPY